MEEEIRNQVYRILDALDETQMIKQLTIQKERMEQDQKLKQQLKLFHKENQNPYSKKAIELKKEIYNYEPVKEFKETEKKLNLFILEINQRLKKLTNTKRNKKNESN